MNNDKIFRPVSRFLLAVMLFNSLPTALLAQDAGPSEKDRKVLTSAAAIDNYRRSFDRFTGEVGLAREELARLDAKLGGELESSEEMKQRMLVLKTLTGKTDAVKKNVKTMEQATGALSGIPQIRTPMKRMHDVSKNAREKLDGLEKELKPLYQKSTTVQERVLIKGLMYRYTLLKQLNKAQKIFSQSLLDTARQTDMYITAGIYCANLNMDEDLTNLAEDLNNMSDKVAAFREILKKINDASVDVEVSIKDLNLALMAFKPIDLKVDALTNLFASISNFLKQIGGFLNARIRFGWSGNFLGKDFSIHINLGIGEILNGPSFLFDLLERTLGEWTFRVLKHIGIDDVIQRFINEAKRRFDELLRKFKIDLNLGLGELTGLDKLRLNLDGLFDKFSGLYLLPDLDLSFDLDMAPHLRLPHFKGLALACAGIKPVDAGVASVKPGADPVKDAQNTVMVTVSSYQDMQAFNKLKQSKGFDAAAYDRNCVLTLEIEGEEKPLTREFVLKAGQTRGVGIGWLPKRTGDVEIKAVLTVDGAEADLENNSALVKVAVAPPDTDLAVLDITALDKGVANVPVLIKVKAVNLDDKYASPAVIKLRAGGDVLESDGLLLDPKAEYTAQFEWTPGKFGPTEIKAEIAPLKTRDLKSANNSLAKTFDIGLTPADLAITTFTVTSEAYSADGSKFGLKVGVKNAGPGDHDKTALLTVTDGRRTETQELALKAGEARDIVLEWASNRKSGAITLEAELKPAINDPDEGNNFAQLTVDIRTEESRKEIAALDKLLEGVKGLTPEAIKRLTELLEAEVAAAAQYLTGGAPRSGDQDTVRMELEKLLERLKATYERKELSGLTELFSRQFPDLNKFRQAIRDDGTFLRSPTLFYRVDSLTMAPDGQSAIGAVHWESQFTLPSGRSYRNDAEMNMKFAAENGEWRIAAMTNNDIFGASLYSLPNLLAELSALNVAALAGDINISGVSIRNIGAGDALNFRVKYTYTRSTGQTYSGYATVPSLAASGGATGLNFTISGAGFVPLPGDSLTIEADPDRGLPEIKLGDNLKTVRYPF